MEFSPGTHLGSYTDRRGANAADRERDCRACNSGLYRYWKRQSRWASWSCTQRTAEQFEDAPQHPEETVEIVASVSHERVAEQMEDALQSPAEVVEADSELPKKWRSTGVGFWKIALQERISEWLPNKISRECLLCGFQLWKYRLISQGVERRRREAW